MNKVVATLIAAGLALGLNTFALAKTVTHHTRRHATHHSMRRTARTHTSGMHMTGMGTSRMTGTSRTNGTSGTTTAGTTTVGSANNTADRDNNVNTVIRPDTTGSNSVPTTRHRRHNVPSAVISNNGQSPAGAAGTDTTTGTGTGTSTGQ